MNESTKTLWFLHFWHIIKQQNNEIVLNVNSCSPEGATKQSTFSTL